jgi:GTPase SAR1 family protein
VVFSVTDAQSLQDLDAFKTQILRAKDSPKVRQSSCGLSFVKGDRRADMEMQTQVPMVICANKIDLEHLREVDRSEGEAVAAKANATYIETRCA